MADENTGVVEADPAAGDQSGVIVPAAEGTEQSQEPAIGGPEDQQTPASESQHPIPQERFNVVNNRMKDAEAEVATLIQQLALSQAREQIRQQAEPAVSVDPMAQVVGEIGDDDIVSGAQMKQAVSKILSVVGTVADNADFAVKHSDYDELVGDPNPTTGKFQPAFQQAIEKDPSILQFVTSLPLNRRRQAAYRFAKGAVLPTTPEAEAVQQGVHPAAAAKLAAAAISDSPMALGGGGALSKAQKVVDMSDGDFATLVEKHAQEHGG